MLLKCGLLLVTLIAGVHGQNVQENDEKESRQPDDAFSDAVSQAGENPRNGFPLNIPAIKPARQLGFPRDRFEPTLPAGVLLLETQTQSSRASTTTERPVTTSTIAISVGEEPSETARPKAKDELDTSFATDDALVAEVTAPDPFASTQEEFHRSSPSSTSRTSPGSALFTLGFSTIAPYLAASTPQEHDEDISHAEPQTEHTSVTHVESQTEQTSFSNAESQTEHDRFSNVESQTEHARFGNIESQTEQTTVGNVESKTTVSGPQDWTNMRTTKFSLTSPAAEVEQSTTIAEQIPESHAESATEAIATTHDLFETTQLLETTLPFEPVTNSPQEATTEAMPASEGEREDTAGSEKSLFVGGDSLFSPEHVLKELHALSASENEQHTVSTTSATQFATREAVRVGSDIVADSPTERPNYFSTELHEETTHFGVEETTTANELTKILTLAATTAQPAAEEETHFDTTTELRHFQFEETTQPESPSTAATFEELNKSQTLPEATVEAVTEISKEETQGEDRKTEDVKEEVEEREEVKTATPMNVQEPTDNENRARTTATMLDLGATTSLPRSSSSGGDTDSMSNDSGTVMHTQRNHFAEHHAEHSYKTPFSFRITSIDYQKGFEDSESGKFKKLRDQLLPDLEEIFLAMFKEDYRGVHIGSLSKGSVIVDGYVLTATKLDAAEELATEFEHRVTTNGKTIGGNDVDVRSVSLNGFISKNYVERVQDNYSGGGTSAFVVGGGIAIGIVAILLVAFAVIAMNNRRANGALKLKEENIAMSESPPTGWTSSGGYSSANVKGYGTTHQQSPAVAGQPSMVIVGSQMAPLHHFHSHTVAPLQ